MSVLLCCWNSVSETGLINAFNRIGCPVLRFDRAYTSIDYDKDYVLALSDFIQAHPDTDFCMSVNFIPIIAKTCRVHRVPYISWTYDSPSLPLYSQAFTYPTNYAFMLDKALVNRFSPRNPGHVFHLPLCCAAEGISPKQVTRSEHERFDCDISFIGSLYTEKCSFRYDAVAPRLPDYLRGYMEGLIKAQLNVYGCNFLADSLRNSYAEEYFSYTGLEYPPEYEASATEIVADFYLGYKCSALDRITTLRAIGEHFPAAVYTNSNFAILNEPDERPLLSNRGIVDYQTEMPKVFKCSKINLNITAKTNRTGIPTRVFDIMAAGGFVISNYQEEIPEYFVPGEDIVLYDSIPDLISKIDYYLSHEEERLTIALNGHEKVKAYHTFDNRLQAMFSQLS